MSADNTTFLQGFNYHFRWGMIGMQTSGGVGTLHQFDTTQGPERTAFFEKTLDLVNPQYQFPQESVEKAVYRVLLYYEDLGNVNVSVTLTTRLGDAPNQALTLTGTNTGRIRIAFFDIICTDDVIKLRVEVSSGRLSLIKLNLFYVPGSEIVENNTI